MIKAYITIAVLLTTLSCVNAWGDLTHEYLCREGLNCSTADYPEYHAKYPYINNVLGNHLCLLNDTNCAARTLARY